MHLQCTHLPCSCCEVSVWWVNSNLLMMLCMCPLMGQLVHAGTCVQWDTTCTFNDVLELKLCTVVHSRLQNSWMYSVNSSALQIKHTWLQLGVTQPWCSVFCDTAAGCNAQKVMNLPSEKSHTKNTYEISIYSGLYIPYGVWPCDIVVTLITSILTSTQVWTLQYSRLSPKTQW